MRHIPVQGEITVQENIFLYTLCIGVTDDVMEYVNFNKIMHGETLHFMTNCANCQSSVLPSRRMCF